MKSVRIVPSVLPLISQSLTSFLLRDLEQIMVIPLLKPTSPYTLSRNTTVALKTTFPAEYTICYEEYSWPPFFLFQDSCMLWKRSTGYWNTGSVFNQKNWSCFTTRKEDRIYIGNKCFGADDLQRSLQAQPVCHLDTFKYRCKEKQIRFWFFPSRF